MAEAMAEVPEGSAVVGSGGLVKVMWTVVVVVVELIAEQTTQEWEGLPA